MKLLLVIMTLGVIASLSVVSIPGAEAGRSFTLAKGTCEHALRGTWAPTDPNTNPKTAGTCSINNLTIIKSGVTMNIPVGVTLEINNNGSLDIKGAISPNQGHIGINAGGVITISNSAANGIYNYGTIENSGTLTIQNTGGTGIFGGGTIENNETLTIQNTGGTGINNYFGTFKNFDIINVYNTNAIGNGVINYGTFRNYSGGTINVNNSGSYGFNLYGSTFTNDSGGTINVNNSGATGGIYSSSSATINNSGIMTITSSGTYGVQSYGPIYNSGGAITVSNTGGFGFRSETTNTFTNSGNFTVSNAGASSLGVQLLGTFNNNNHGNFTASNTGASSTGVRVYGTINNNSGGRITSSNTNGIGIDNNSGGGLINNYSDGTINVYNSDGAGIQNNSNLHNYATINISNSGGIGIQNIASHNIYNEGLIDMTSIAGSAGIWNYGTIDNSEYIKMRTSATNAIINDGTISNGGTICNTGSYDGTIPTSGNAVVTGCS